MSRAQAEHGQRPEETQADRPSPATASPSRPGSPAKRRPARPATVYERDAEQVAIRQALDSAAAGRGRLVVVEGPAGSGRSLLLNLAVRIARSKGFDVVTARGNASERDFAYGVARQLFEDRLQKASLLERQRLLSGPAGIAGPVFGLRVDGPVIDGPERHHRTAHGIAWIARNLSATAPTLVAIDDADEADIESMRAVNRLNQRLEESPIVILVSVRQTHDQDVRGPAEELRTHTTARIVKTAPLSATSITRMVRERFFPKAPDDFCQRLAHWCGGSPALVREVVTAIHAAGRSPVDGEPLDLADFVPENVARGVATRIGRLSPEATAFARAIAVLGDGALAAHAAVLSRLEGPRPHIALDALVRAGFITTEGMGLCFTTPIEAAAILANSPVVERGRAHLQAARLLRGQGADDDDIAGQLLRANQIGDRWAVAVLERAATGALARGEPELAVSYLERAVAEPPPPDRSGPIMAMLGQAEVVAGLSTAAERFRAAAGLLDDPAERAAVFDDLGRRLLINGNTADAAVAFAQGLEAVTDATSEVALRLLAGLIRTVHADPSLRPRWKDNLSLPPTPQGIDSHQALPAGRALLAVVYLDRIYDGAPAGVVAHLLFRLVETIEEHGDPQREAATLCDAGLALIICGELDAAEHALTLAMDHARSPGLRLSIATRRAKLRFLQGRLLDAEADAVDAVREAAAVTAALGPTANASAAAGVLALVRIEQGRLAAAADDLAAGADEDKVGSVGVWEIASGWLAMARTRPHAAYDHFLRASQTTHRPTILSGEAGAALAAHRLGRVDEARQLADQNLRRAQAGALRGPLAEAKRVLGVVTGGPEGHTLLREALKTVRTVRADLEEAKVLVELGAALIESEDRAAGAEILREGMAKATACGADGLVEEARRRLRAVARPEPGSAGAALTPNQSRVAELASVGRTNSEIAEELAVSVRAVEWHLRNSYRKLGITTRSELGEVLDEQAIGPPGGERLRRNPPSPS